MGIGVSNSVRGYTVIELMVTVVIVAVLAATVGAFVVKLLTLQENEREDAYIREKLVEMCSAYADFMSIGSSFGTNQMGQVKIAYRQETGGVSLETGTVSRVTSLISSVDLANGMLDLRVYGPEAGTNVLKLARRANGIASLIPLVGNVVNYTITPINATTLELANLGNLKVEAQYRVKNRNGEYEIRTTSAERIVRLWNHQ